MKANGKTSIETLHAAVPGRTRLRIRKLRGNQVLGEVVGERLGSLDNVSRAQVSTITGTVLILHHPELSRSELIREAEQALAVAIQNGVEHRRSRPRAKHGSAIKELQVALQVWKNGPWYALPSDEVAMQLSTPLQHGLSVEEAANRLDKFGRNALPQAKRRSDLAILASQFASLPVVLLGVSAVLSIATGGVLDAVVITVVVVINAALGYRTERDVERTLHSLEAPPIRKARVIREGRQIKVDASELVPGDLVLLGHDDVIPADGRVVHTHELMVDESSLTGESDAVLKNPEPLPQQNNHVPLGDRWSMVYRGTTVVGGGGTMLITATGGATEIGQVERLMTESRAPETPMQRELRETGHKLVMASLGICGLVFAIGLLRGYRLIEMLQSSISLAVAAIPEGLPTVATTTLARGVNRLQKRKVLVRRLDSVETLAGVQTICLDKTGTLTLNQMRVTQIVTGTGRIERQELTQNQSDPDLRQLLMIALLCNEVSEVADAGKASKLQGSSTERALVDVAQEGGFSFRALRRKFPIARIEPRTMNRKRMTTIHTMDADRQFIAVKGEPNEVLAECHLISKHGHTELLTEADRIRIRAENERMAGAMLRVLGFAFQERSKGSTDGDSPLIWCGLTGMQDMLRDGAAALIRRLHEAGIHTMMLTGDQSPTAYAIASSLGLASNGEPLKLLDSRRLDAMSADELKELAPKVHVFSRVNPADKLKIVRALQSSGQVVAMTGDGINDGPALKAADIGIAIGGMELAHKVADMVVLNDDIEPILMAVEEGRVISDDIRKSIHFLLATNLSEIMTSVLAVALGLGTPLSAIQLLWINLLSDIFPELALAAEPAEAGILKRPPGNSGERIVGRSSFEKMGWDAALMTTGALASYGFGLSRYGRGPQARTLSFLTLMTGQLLYTKCARSEKHSIFDRLIGSPPEKQDLGRNRYIGMAMGAGFLVELLALATAPMRQLLGITSIGVADGLVCGLGSLAPFFIKEASKAVSKPSPRPVCSRDGVPGQNK